MYLKAKWLLCDANTVHENVIVHVEKGKIVRLISGRRWTSRRVADCQESLLMPGLVNAHCHLELSALKGKIVPRTSFTPWIKAGFNEYQNWSRKEWESSLRMGLDLLRKNGITTVGDICRRIFLLPLLKKDLIRKTVFCEVIEPDPRKADKSISDMQNLLHTFHSTATFLAAISPHAPYTVSSALYRKIDAFSKKKAIKWVTHLAETQEEHQFTQKGAGPLAELLRQLKRPLPFECTPHTTPVEYLSRLGVLGHHSILIHANYLMKRDIERLQEHHTPVVFCPRSHRYFNHEPYPIRQLLKAKIQVALGTDSLASNDDLSLLKEMQLFRKSYHVDPRHIFTTATRAGAQALFSYHAPLGKIAPNFLADIIGIATPQPLSRSELFEFLCTEAEKVTLTMVNGKVIEER